MTENTNLFHTLWSDVTTFVDGLERFESDDLEKQLEKIREDIKALIKEALLRNLRDMDANKVSIDFSNASSVRVTMQENKYRNLLSQKERDMPAIQKRLIAKATEGKIAKSIAELEHMLKKKKDEADEIVEVLGYEHYDKVLDLLDMKCMKLQNPILAFEKPSDRKEFNRAEYMLYYLWLKLGHKLKVFGNANEIYIYDRIADKTIICSDSKGYRTYIAQGEIDIFDIGEYTREMAEQKFVAVPFEGQKQREHAIKEMIRWFSSLDMAKTPQLGKQARKITRKTKEELISVLTVEEEFTQIASEKLSGNEQPLEETKIEGLAEKRELLQKEFLMLFPTDDAFDHEKLIKHMKKKHVELPTKLSSINSRFGKTPYIFEKEYTLALLRGDYVKAKEIEVKVREKRGVQSENEKNQEIRKEFAEFFGMSEKKQEKYIEEHPGFLKNLHVKATNLWGVPIGNIEYIKAIVGDDLETRLSYEVSLIKEKKISVYSKIIYDLMAEFKKQWGNLADFWNYVRQIQQGEQPVIKWPSSSNGNKNVLHERKRGDVLSMDDIINLYDEIFPKKDGKNELTEENYKNYLKRNPDKQKVLPKSIYGLINYFKSRDPHAHEMVHSIKYLQALLENKMADAGKERMNYLEKKIKESKSEDIQIMLMYIRRYVEKSRTHISVSSRSMYAKQETISKIKKANPKVTKILNNGNCVVSYALVDTSMNFNNMDFSSMRNALAKKVDDIRKSSPHIYNMRFSVVE